jgi:xanthine dehydrogenase accessory factor
MLEVFREIARRVAEGETVALATIVTAKGSTPRGIGSKMMIAADGSIVGTVGGGIGEHEVWRAAPDVIRTRVPRVVHVELTNDSAAREGAICGGTMDVFVEAIGTR